MSEQSSKGSLPRSGLVKKCNRIVQLSSQVCILIERTVFGLQ